MPPSEGYTRIYMLFSLLRSPKCRQVGQIELNISIDGTSATPVASGPDSAFVQSVVKNSTGNYTVTLKEPAKQNLHISSIVSMTADASSIALATGTPKLSFSIVAKSVAASPIAKDIDFSVQVIFFDQLSYFF